MRVIVCGGRDYDDHLTMHEAVAAWVAQYGWPTEIVSGAAPGADALGEEWAQENAVPVRRFPADWGAHGRRAGPLRNAQLASHADGCIALPGARGTADMVRQARAAGIPVLLWS
ncbi:DUF2493 domain-containing protein [Deinococcus sp. 12RED42]|uniref:DUF2493 domain-containing protein n=1 Tax=Deinococcus sp. 12RED42 TaxID=2745872 RepID=UPI001E5178F7|nr:DUF2493 domain-containing protein [Deinococcus sp. 12RED42]